MADKITRYFKIVEDEKESVSDALAGVYRALQKKGYKPVNQIVGYSLSDDPTYITRYDNARSRSAHFTRDEILEELIGSYIVQNKLDREDRS